MAQRKATSRSSASNKPYKYKYKKQSSSKAKLLLRPFKKNKKLAPALAILLFAAIGSSFVYFAKASSVTLANIEAETITLASGSRVVNDSAASGSKAVQFDNNSAITGSASLAQSATSITVRAKGTQCKGAPQMVVALGGTQVLSSSVGSSGYSDYTADISLAKGTHALSISFNNSYSYTHNNAKKNCSRNMTVDKITVYGAASEAVSSSNLAVGRPVTTSASWSERLPLATDGKMDTGYANIAGRPQWIQIDLGQQQPVGTVKLWHYFKDSRTYRDVIVQLSNKADFSSKTTIYNNDRDNSSGQVAGNDSEYTETSAGRTISLASAIDARYVRLWSNGSNVNGANHYVEVEVSKNINAVAPPVSPDPNPEPAPTGGSSLVSANFDGPDSAFVTSSAFWNNADDGLYQNTDWFAESGSLYRRSNLGYSKSSVFRMWTRQTDLAFTKMEMDVQFNGWAGGTSGWHGINMWLNRKLRTPADGNKINDGSQQEGYAIDFNNRDGKIYIQKKVAGTYYILKQDTWAPVTGKWYHWSGRVIDNGNGTSTIQMLIDGQIIQQAVDNGSVGGPRLTGGRAGLRSDYANYNVDNLLINR